MIRIAILVCLWCMLVSLRVVTAFSTRASLKDVLQLKVIAREEQVLFFPTCAYSQDDSVLLPIHGWIFDNEKRSKRRRAFLALLRNVVDDVFAMEQDSFKSILARRINPFLVDNHRRRKITIQLLGNDMNNKPMIMELPKRSLKNGHFQGTLRLSKDKVSSLTSPNSNEIHYQAVTGIKGDDRIFAGVSQVLQPTGLSVISDIDDTVKVSHVLEKKRLVQHTFLQEFQPVPGMASLYQRWHQEKQASFHYVSSSPWQLYPELASFLADSNFPNAASFSLKSIRLKDRSLLSLFADPMVSKISKISSIIETFPNRTFVLVGDTGERDPEVYGEICRRYPHQVERVFLRDVVSELDEHVLQEVIEKQRKKKKSVILNAPDRYIKAFDGVPSNKWSLFTDADTIDY